ncbi:MAG: hypothetical protein PHS44_00055 [Candidatus Dojkabacteria bacterium]|nr:hypothetical protein [Candidatus Dojkabacteria bacterium]
MSNIYHIFRSDLEGYVLYPLNQLKSKFPKAYKKQVEKYEGREELMKRKIPILNCLWNDVIHLSPVNPQKIKEALQEAGCNYKQMSYWVIDSYKLNPQNTVVFLYTSDEGYLKEDFIPYSPELVNKYNKVPHASRSYFKSCAKEKRKPLFFHRIPHVLYKGTIDTRDLETLKI